MSQLSPRSFVGDAIPSQVSVPRPMLPVARLVSSSSQPSLQTAQIVSSPRTFMPTAQLVTSPRAGLPSTHMISVAHQIVSSPPVTPQVTRMISTPVSSPQTSNTNQMVSFFPDSASRAMPAVMPANASSVSRIAAGPPPVTRIVTTCQRSSSRDILQSPQTPSSRLNRSSSDILMTDKSLQHNAFISASLGPGSSSRFAGYYKTLMPGFSHASTASGGSTREADVESASARESVELGWSPVSTNVERTTGSKQSLTHGATEAPRTPSHACSPRSLRSRGSQSHEEESSYSYRSAVAKAADSSPYGAAAARHTRLMQSRSVGALSSANSLGNHSSHSVTKDVVKSGTKSPRRLSLSEKSSTLATVTNATKALIERSLMVKDMSAIVLDSDCRKLKVDQYLNAHARQVSWLEKALRQQINDYEIEWDAMLKHEAEEQRAKTVQQQQRADAEKRTQDHILARQQREYKVQQNNTALDHKRRSKAQQLLEREELREQRLAVEREQRLEEIAQRAQGEAARHEEVLREGVRIVQAVSAAHAAKAKFKREKAEGLSSESKRIQLLRKDTSDNVEHAIASMKHMILQQRIHSVIDVDALEQHMRELMDSLQI